MADLCTLAQVKEFLKIATGTTTDDALLTRLISAASVRIEQYIQRNIGTLSATVTETRNGSGTTQMFLSRWPVTAVTSLTINGVSVPAATSQGTAGFVCQTWDGVTIPIKEPVLMLTGGYGLWQGAYGPGGYGIFAPGNANVTIVYTAGFAEVPADLVQACIELVVQEYNQRLRVGTQNNNLATQSQGYILTMLPSVKEALRPYKRVTPYTL